MTLRTQLAYGAAAATLAIGLLALINPMLMARLLGLEIVSPRGFSELRSSYGALTLALGGLMLWALPLRPKSARLLRILAILVAAAALGRLASIAIDGVVNLANLLLLLAQSAVAGAVFWSSSEKPLSRREQRAKREAEEARDEAARARLAAAEAGQRQPKDAGPGQERP